MPFTRPSPSIFALSLSSALAVACATTAVATDVSSTRAPTATNAQRAETSAAPVRRASSPTREPATPALVARMDSVVRAFSERGGRVLDAEWTAFVGPGDARVARVHVGRAQCVGFVAVGVASLRKVGLRVHDPSGVLLGEHQDDAHPYLRLCAREDAHLTVVLRALEGQGQLALALVGHPPLVAPDLGRALGDHHDGGLTGPRTPRAAVGADPAEESALDALARHRQRLGSLGYRPHSDALTGEIERRVPTEQRFDFEAGLCYGVLVTSDPDSDAITFELVDPDGRAIITPRAIERDPFVRGCLARTGSYIVRLSSREGARFAVQALALDERVALPQDVVGEVRAGVLELSAEGRGRGLTRLRAVHRVAAVGVAVNFPIEISAGRCVMIGAAVSGSAVELSLNDEQRGTLLASDTGGGATPRVWHCATRTTRARLTARPAANRGEFAVAIFDEGDSR